MIRFEEITVIAAPVQRVFDLSRSVEVHLLLANTHGGEQARTVNGVTLGLIGLGEQVTWRAKHLRESRIRAGTAGAWRVPFGLSASRWMIEAGCFLMRTDRSWF